jgi:hypothetical protein
MGYGASMLAAASPTRTYGIDIDPHAIDEARRRYRSDAIEFHCGDATVAELPRSIDVAICYEGIEHVISTPNVAATGGHSGNPFHRHEFSREEFEGLLLRYFRNVTMFFQWGYDAPYDWKWTAGKALRLIVPLRVKQFVRKQFCRPPRLAESNQALERSALRHRPFPVTYLAAPGLGLEPRTWLAVCGSPRKAP